MHAEFRERLNEFNNHSDQIPPIWSFQTSVPFKIFDDFLQRLNEIKDIFVTANEFMKLEKVEIGGIKGKQIKRNLQIILDEFTMLYSEWTNISNKIDILEVDLNVKDFQREKERFDRISAEMERKLSTQFNLAFDECNTTTQVTTLILILGTMMHRPIILTEIRHRYNDVIMYFTREMEMVKKTFDRGIKNIKEKDLMALPIDPGHPPLAGALKWIRQLRSRLNQPAGNFPLLDYP